MFTFRNNDLKKKIIYLELDIIEMIEASEATDRNNTTMFSVFKI